MRGEYHGEHLRGAKVCELPPRARRIPPATIESLIHKGTTSACAENTAIKSIGDIFTGNYLRVRGEYGAIEQDADIILELPPRARRIRIRGQVTLLVSGTTSACAENTVKKYIVMGPPWNYLRVRGEYTATGYTVTIPWELPPRARRIQAATY